MDLEQRMAGLDGPQAIEVAHLLFRYLTHPFSKQAFRGRFLAEGPASEARERSYEIALQTVRDIEREVGSKIDGFSERTRRSYIDQLARLSKQLQPAGADPVVREKAEHELQLLRSM